MEQNILDRFPYASFKGFERLQVEDAVKRIAAAHSLCLAEDGYGGDEEQLIDDMFDILKPSEDEELLMLRVVNIYLDML